MFWTGKNAVLNPGDLPTSFFTKEQPWAIRSHPSLQKSDREKFAHIPLYKVCLWAIRSLKKKDVSDLLVIGANRSQKTKQAIRLKNS